MITKNLLKILWLGLLLCFGVACAVLLVCYSPVRHLSLVLLLLLLLGSAIWAYLTIKVLEFRKKLLNFLRQLLSGNYDVGIEIKSRDDLSKFLKLLNKLSDQLRIYDQLRVDRVSLNYRGLDLLYRTVSEGITLADMGKRVFKLNPVVQSLFNVKQERFSFDAIGNQQRNEEFVALFRQATEQEKVTKEGNVTLQLPMRDAVRDLFVRIIPLKDAQEVVQLAFIFIKPDATTEPIPIR